MTLLEAMRLAEHRDRIAWQFTHDFADIFARGLPALAEVEARHGDGNWAMTGLYLHFLATIPDSLIVRKHGVKPAERVRREAGRWAEALAKADNPETLQGDLMAFDSELKARAVNPGTTADLTVATLFAQSLME